ncbi:alpha/beta hydrolase [Nitrospirillum sp. BR 11828]|uniref:alpha/beta fold hydrolase n=1 Tax=Nitrospirillum sp. BR 11828 TaxID=3104325 RepID=UPI002ACAA1C6|nr:alpha/beta hydrolase [Nitrospirillum sp. BR 11828]MDZ5648506.1 alpha/beta hydrolase [Nitrospirillum sp. BR 11828]
MKIASNGIRLHVEDIGRGEPTLVFLHYWGGSARTWRHVTSRLAPSFRTVALDHRGWGHSDAPSDGYALADMADDAAGVIAALDLRRYVLVGHSMGGKVAQLLASRRPSGLAGLVLVAPSPPQPMAMPGDAREQMAGAYATRETVGMVIDHVLTAKALAPEDREQVIEDSLRGAPAAKVAWPQSTSLEDISDWVGSVNVPTLVVAGELDRVDSVDLLKTTLVPRIAGATLHVLAGIGHLSMLEAPDDVARLVAGFASGLY